MDATGRDRQPVSEEGHANKAWFQETGGDSLRYPGFINVKVRTLISTLGVSLFRTGSFRPAKAAAQSVHICLRAV